ncbi:MAG: hypothetical protein B6244_09520 [Candidatus Cloacimonetes bacterium 4572_55]|nr:MAG: hypothetical protein B6244_09520 [Candidatus Cloacimonetes bacterium 4572_55]
MARKRVQFSRKNKAIQSESLEFGKLNIIVFAIGLLFIAVGFLTLSKGDTVLAPILLVLGYCALIPAAIIIKGKQESVGD